MKIRLLVFAALAAVVSCAPRERIPAAPDYDSPEAWYVTDRGADVDLFYISSTETFDATVGRKVYHFAQAADSAACPGIRAEMEGVDRILKPSRRAPVHTKDSFPDSLNLCRFDPVPVDLNHVCAASDQHQVAIRQFPADIAGMVDAIPQDLIRLFPEIDIAAEERIFHRDLSRCLRGNLVSFLIHNPDMDLFHVRLSDRTLIVRFIYDEFCKREAAFTHRVRIYQLRSFEIETVCRFTADLNLPYIRPRILNHAKQRGRCAHNRNAVIKKILAKLQRILNDTV